MISNSTISRINEEVDIKDVVESRIPGKLQPAGQDHSWKAICPFHNDRNPSFFVDDEKGVFHCFGCDAKGNMIQFIQQSDGVDFETAARTIAKDYQIPIEEKRMTSNEEEKKKTSDLIQSFSELAHLTLVRSAKGKKVLKEVLDRKINEEIIDKYNLGYTYKGLIDNFFRTNEVKISEQIKTNLINVNQNGQSYEMLHDRVTFPLKDIDGNIIGISGRKITGQKTNKKYKISVMKKVPFFFYDAIKKNDRVYLVEGFYDVISLDMAGIKNSISAGGTTLSNDQLKDILSISTEITLVMDGDRPGIISMHKLAKTFDEYDQFNDLNITFVMLPKELDVDDYRKKFGTEKLKDFVTNNQLSRVEFEIMYASRTSKPNEKIKNVANVINRYSNGPIEKNRLLNDLSKKANIPLEVIKNEVSDNDDSKQDETFSMLEEIEYDDIDDDYLSVIQNSVLMKMEVVIVRYILDNGDNENYSTVLVHDYAKDVLDGKTNDILSKFFKEQVENKKQISYDEAKSVYMKLKRQGKALLEIEEMNLN